tara:strand:+ start:179 stop:430 length:252 start_codon:yes stop_codon:yes gene_type:complete
MQMSDFKYKNAIKADFDFASDCSLSEILIMCKKYNCFMTKAELSAAGLTVEISAQLKTNLLCALSAHHDTTVDDEFLESQIKQ